jgi:uncharacterized protein YaaR (DUF327 family)
VGPAAHHAGGGGDENHSHHAGKQHVRQMGHGQAACEQLQELMSSIQDAGCRLQMASSTHHMWNYRQHLKQMQ